MPSNITNTLNLPDQIYKACLYDSHKVAGDISVSQLIENPRVIMLKRINEYTEDVSQRLYALMGHALHHILERANISNVEKRAFVTVLHVMEGKLKNLKDDKKRQGIIKVMEYLTKFMNALYPEPDERYFYEMTQRVQIGDKVLYGTLDLYDKLTGILYDYKFCSTFMFTNPESQQKWEAQLNIYAWMLVQAGYEVKEIRVVAFFRDWNALPFSRRKDYPDYQIKEISIKIRTPSEMLMYVTKRMELHTKADETGIMPMCSGRERWATSDSWAVKTPYAKKALRADPNKAVCEQFMFTNAERFENMFLEFRPGISNKCEKACLVKDFCDQYKIEKEMRIKQSADD